MIIFKQSHLLILHLRGSEVWLEGFFSDKKGEDRLKNTLKGMSRQGEIASPAVLIFKGKIAASGIILSTRSQKGKTSNSGRSL
jgi:hypothetical protein